jgi:hypothetical protein
VFAYTVRADWRVKFTSDCKKTFDNGHDPNVFVFICTEALTATEKDWAHGHAHDKYGWDLDLFDLERLRAQLVGPQRHLLAHHPSIFTPPIFPQRGGESIAESRDTLLIDHVPADHALATWLARRLSLAGFRTWCNGTAPLAGENPDESVRKLMEVRAIQYLPVLSETSLADSVFAERCTIAAAREGFVIPCAASVAPAGPVPSRLAQVAPAVFVPWSAGLEQILGRLAALGVGPTLDLERGRQIALGDYLPTRVTAARPEPVFANVFPLQLPQSMLVFDLQRSLTDTETQELRRSWAFVEIGPFRLVAFAPPPARTIPQVKVERTPEFAWADKTEKDGKKPVDLAKELAWRSLEVACAQKGLRYCGDRKVFYFPERVAGAWNQTYDHVDGRRTTVQLTGERTKGWGDRASLFRYQLAPKFRPQQDYDGSWNVALNLYVRVADLDGKVFEGKEIARRRKVVTRSWWNQQWLARLLGVVQALETAPGQLKIGEGARSVVMKSKPLGWQCPVALDVLALSGMSDIGLEMAEYRARDESDDQPGGVPAAAEGEAVDE